MIFVRCNGNRRCFAAATIGWLLVAGASPGQGAQTNQSDTSEAAKQHLPSAPTPFKQPVEGRDPDPGCDDGKEDRKSDLCAQWKSADAAKKSADWAGLTFWIAVVGTAIGALTLFAAAFAAWFAREAARHTKSGANEAGRAAKAAEDALGLSRDVTHADLRAWLKIDVELLVADRTKESVHFDIKVRIENIGKTPALRVGVDRRVYIGPSFRIGDGEPPLLDRRKSPICSIMPGDQTEHSFGERLDNDDVEAGMDIAQKIGCLPIVFIDAVVSYHTVFETENSTPHVSSIRYVVMPAMTSPDSMEARFRWLVNGPYGADGVIFRREKGAPIQIT